MASTPNHTLPSSLLYTLLDLVATLALSHTQLRVVSDLDHSSNSLVLTQFLQSIVFNPLVCERIAPSDATPFHNEAFSVLEETKHIPLFTAVLSLQVRSLHSVEA